MPPGQFPEDNPYNKPLPNDVLQFREDTPSIQGHQMFHLCRTFFPYVLSGDLVPIAVNAHTRVEWFLYKVQYQVLGLFQSKTPVVYKHHQQQNNTHTIAPYEDPYEGLQRKYGVWVSIW